MNVFVSGRVGGKTAKIVEWYREDPVRNYIIVATGAERTRLVRDFDVPPDRVLTLPGEGRGLPPDAQFGVDGLESWFARLWGYSPHFATLTADAVTIGYGTEQNT